MSKRASRKFGRYFTDTLAVSQIGALEDQLSVLEHLCHEAVAFRKRQKGAKGKKKRQRVTGVEKGAAPRRKKKVAGKTRSVEKA
mmetsp:Transcript_2052/g.5082  ORF Transcript_2052/g.5082 Transcript_2052/m.5082 type:complete len:84 (-) Transcript_2052:52-303(-)